MTAKDLQGAPELVVEGDRFARPVELSRETGDTLTTPLLPGLTLPLERIFKD